MEMKLKGAISMGCLFISLFFSGYGYGKNDAISSLIASLGIILSFCLSEMYSKKIKETREKELEDDLNG